MKSKTIVGLGAFLVLAVVGMANNIRVSNVGLSGHHEIDQRVNVVFDLAWENSWRNGDLYDAAWVFIKFRGPGEEDWQHAILSTNQDHCFAQDGIVTPTEDGLGAFVFSAGDHAGNVSYRQIKLRWEYGENGENFTKGDKIEVSVHALEMVYIPEGPFFLGGVGSEDGRFYCFNSKNPGNNIPYPIRSEAEIPVAQIDGNLFYLSGTYAGDQQGPIPIAFPKGYNAFYCMKYDISQGQYADFLNKLTSNQCTNRYFFTNPTQRYTLTKGWPEIMATAPDRACNYLSWADLTAYLDWAALRPMTELEFEKACRGPERPVPNEYPWGTTKYVQLAGEDESAGSGHEIATPTNANVSFICAAAPLGFGPVRVGIFARPGSTREESGAGYYGVMDLAGGVTERVISVGHSTGRQFTGLHGNGQLTTNGYADVDFWPGTNAVGTGMRGCNAAANTYLHVQSSACTACRIWAAMINYQRNPQYAGNASWQLQTGGRGVRTAPK